MVQKEKVVKQYTRKSKSGKTVVVKQHTAKYDAAEDIAKQALKSKEGSGKELEDLKKKKPVAQKEEVKSPYEEYGFTKDEFKEWYEGTGSKADKKVEKALKKAMGTKAYTAFSDKAADEYKKGGAHRFFTKGLEEMKASTSADKKSVTSGKEAKKEAGIDTKVSKEDSAKLKKAEKRQSDYVKHLMRLHKDGVKDKQMGGYIAAEKQILEDLKKHKGSLKSDGELKKAGDTKKVKSLEKLLAQKEKSKSKTPKTGSSEMTKYRAYRKELNAKKKAGKKLSPAETTKLKKLAKAAGVGRFID